MSLLGDVTATEERYRGRQAERQHNLACIQKREILKIAANTPELVAQRLARLRADPERVKTLQQEGASFDPPGPGRTPQQFPRALERVLDTNDLMGMRFFAQGMQVAKAVGRVHIRGERGQEVGFGTGFLVSPRLLLTNHHVFPSAVHARRSMVEFNYQEGATGEMQASALFPLAPEAFYLCDTELDYALVAVAPDPALAAYGWLPLIADLGKLLVGETVNIIQHPNGEPKQLAIRHNQVVDELELFLHYQTDTDPGSSGSPVFNDQWEVVALHHSGVPKRNAKGEILTSDGRIWQEWMGEQRIAWMANEGVRVSRLVRHIQQQDLPAEAEPLRQQLLEAAPPPPIAPAVAAETPPEVVEAAPSAPVAPAPATTWTIPLQVSISLGSPTLQPPAADLEGAGQARGEGMERWAFFGPRPPSPPVPPAAPAVSPADFRLASLANTSFDWQTALSLCLASELAYSPPAKVKAQALAWGFQGCAFLENQAAQGFLAWSSDVALVTFRGTESTADWLSNLNVTTGTIPGVGQVHAGFLGQFQALESQLESLLSARPNLPLMVTGHSLGGGIAVLAAISWAGGRAVRALYTYGQPAVAKTNAASVIGSTLQGRYHRLVNDVDIVPRVPPGYRHAGHLLHFDGQGRVSQPAMRSAEPPAARGGAERMEAPEDGLEPPMVTSAEFKALQQQLKTGATARGQEGLSSLISDHMLPAYLGKIRQQIS